MKRQVTITLEVDGLEYEEADDSPSGVLELVEAMADNEADWPERMVLTCEGLTKTFERKY